MRSRFTCNGGACAPQSNHRRTLVPSRAEARDIELQLTAHTPESLLQSFGPDARVLSEYRGLRYVQTHQGLGRVLVEPRWLRRVLLNLLANALNASPPGGTVTLDSVMDARVWRVSLADSGPGSPRNYVNESSSVFFVLPPPRTRKRAAAAWDLPFAAASLHFMAAAFGRKPRRGRRIVRCFHHTFGGLIAPPPA